MYCTVQYTAGMPSSTAIDRPERYLDIALELFSANGYDGTSTDMIVAEAGGSKATLYQSFPAKAALIDGLVERLGRSGTASGLDQALLDAPLTEGLAAIGRRVAELGANLSDVEWQRERSGARRRATRGTA